MHIDEVSGKGWMRIEFQSEYSNVLTCGDKEGKDGSKDLCIDILFPVI